MKSLTTSLTRLRALTRTRTGSPERVLVHPMREWMTCLIITGVVALFLFGFEGFDFYTQSTVIDTPPVTETSAPKYRREDAESIIRYYKGREAAFTELRRNHAPSLVVPAAPQLEVPSSSPSGVVEGDTTSVEPVAETPVAQ